MKELSVIQKTYDCIKWYIPIIERLPKIHKFTLGDRIINGLYDLLEGLIKAKYGKNKLYQLESLNTQLDILRYNPENCRSAYRNNNRAERDNINNNIGFRVVCVVGSTLHPKGSSVCWDGNRLQQQNSPRELAGGNLSRVQPKSPAYSCDIGDGIRKSNRVG